MPETPVVERICTKCRIVKPLDEFSSAPRGKYGKKASCKECDAARHARLHPPKPRSAKLRREPLSGTAEKTCTKCNQVKTVDEFSVSRRATQTSNAVYRSWCKICASAQAMEWYRANPERSNANKRRNNLKSLYGLSQSEYDDLVRAQHGVCAICGNGREGRLHVDHDHSNGKVRGLLCNRCNRAVGLLGDDPTILRKAISYLLRAKEIHQGGQ